MAILVSLAIDLKYYFWILDTYSYHRIDTPHIQNSVDIHGRSSGEIRRTGRFTGGWRAMDQTDSSGMCKLNFYFRWVCMCDATRHDSGASLSAGFRITLVYFWSAIRQINVIVRNGNIVVFTIFSQFANSIFIDQIYKQLIACKITNCKYRRKCSIYR